MNRWMAPGYLEEFVSSRQVRIEQANADWKMARFDAVPGDSEYIPLPQV